MIPRPDGKAVALVFVIVIKVSLARFAFFRWRVVGEDSRFIASRCWRAHREVARMSVVSRWSAGTGRTVSTGLELARCCSHPRRTAHSSLSSSCQRSRFFLRSQAAVIL